MTYLQQINQWSITHHPKWLVVLRTLLGVSLFIKGIQFLKNTAVLEQMISHSPVSQEIMWLNIFIPWLHLFGGSMIIVGLYTRISAAIQMPVLIGAVFLIDPRQGVFSGDSVQIFSVVVLFLLFVFLIEGGGPFSLDNAMRSSKNK
jgi:uncharacterized membrane protein YphA (DoxX/SURF4 family)